MGLGLDVLSLTGLPMYDPMQYINAMLYSSFWALHLRTCAIASSLGISMYALV